MSIGKKLSSEVGFLNVGMIDQFRGFAFERHPTCFQHISIICHFEGSVSILLNEQNREILAIQPNDDIKDRIHDNWSES